MRRQLFVLLIIVLAFSLSSKAGTITGRVSGSPGVSVVYVEAIPGKTFPPAAEHPVMAQKRLMFEPHLLPVQQGATVDFLNSDSVAHNVFWTSVGGNKKKAHNLGTWPQNDKRSFMFDAAGAVPLLCNVHPEMSAYIVVVPTPYFALTKESGEYTIDNIPDGTYNLTAWHEGFKHQPQQVVVAGEAKADLALSK